ncbi:NADH-quinone oxidoreductase subunit N [Neorickettsia sp. 179522]|uniref:NADH-quinone oxidoreductase subunit N n=1 Tax=Neorickettsia sp. 179522 TaxID=1714371 RepID=UPI0007973466|nr:proton-conducting transporter membrane subunit [Neorickettsia sp. 179522]KYH12684.1 NADH-quinone oxidoreductase subunit N [Neorickettsia sp. 179522]
MNQYLFLLPEITLFTLSCLLLFLKGKNEIGLVSVLITFAVTFFSYTRTSVEILNGMLHISPFTQTVKLVILAFACVFFLQAVAVKQSYSKNFSVLVLLSLLGMLLSVSSSTLPSLYLAVELHSIGQYILACIKHKSIKSTEAGVKYTLLGTFMSAVMIYGISLIFTVSGDLSIKSLFVADNKIHSIGILLFISGLMFKIAAAPFHAWVGDIYEGSPTISTTFFAVLPKLSLIVVLVSLISNVEPIAYGESAYSIELIKNSQYLRNILFICGILSIAFGTLSAFGQKNIKRFIGFASITHVGYMLLGISNSASLSFGNPGIAYALVYSFTNLGILSVVLMLKDKHISSLKKLRCSNNLVALAFVLLLFSSAGVPPFIGFWSKAYIVKTLIETNHIPTALFSMLAGIISAFYYARIAKETYFINTAEQNTETSLRHNKLLSSVVILCALFSTFGFILLVY